MISQNDLNIISAQLLLVFIGSVTKVTKRCWS